MYETMEATNGYSAIVFVFIVIAGQFIVLNIFLAVVLAVNGLERRVEERDRELREQEAAFGRIFDTMPDAYIVTELATGKILR